MIIYKTTNLINGKIYVGKYEGNRDTYLGSGKILRYAFIKYGKENFKRETIEECNNRDQLNQRERFWIKELNSQFPNGYNLSEGGDWGDVLTNHPYRQEIIEKRAKNLRKYLTTSEGKEQRSNNSKKMWENPDYLIKQVTAQKEAQNRPHTKLNKSIKGKIAQSAPEVLERKSNDIKRSRSNPAFLKKLLDGVNKRWENQELFKCTYCEVVSKNITCINRWHNENCKHKTAKEDRNETVAGD